MFSALCKTYSTFMRPFFNVNCKCFKSLPYKYDFKWLGWKMLSKTFWEKEKMLVTGISKHFKFESHNYMLSSANAFILDWFKIVVFGKELNIRRSLLKTLWGKEKMLVSSIFSFSHNVFNIFQNKFQIFIHIYFVVCKCFEFEPVKNFVNW